MPHKCSSCRQFTYWSRLSGCANYPSCPRSNEAVHAHHEQNFRGGSHGHGNNNFSSASAGAHNDPTTFAMTFEIGGHTVAVSVSPQQEMMHIPKQPAITIMPRPMAMMPATPTAGHAAPETPGGMPGMPMPTTPCGATRANDSLLGQACPNKGLGKGTHGHRADSETAEEDEKDASAASAKRTKFNKIDGGRGGKDGKD